jgi:hypothetical protein
MTVSCWNTTPIRDPTSPLYTCLSRDVLYQYAASFANEVRVTKTWQWAAETQHPHVTPPRLSIPASAGMCYINMLLHLRMKSGLPRHERELLKHNTIRDPRLPSLYLPQQGCVIPICCFICEWSPGYQDIRVSCWNTTSTRDPASPLYTCLSRDVLYQYVPSFANVNRVTKTWEWAAETQNPHVTPPLHNTHTWPRLSSLSLPPQGCVTSIFCFICEWSPGY